MDKEFNPKNIFLILGTNIRNARETKGISISKLASSIDYDRGCLSALEYGEQNLEYLTVLNLARKLNTPFPTLFFPNYLNTSTSKNIGLESNYTEDDFLLVFIENFQRIMKRKQLKQIEVYSATNIQTATISRITNRKALNPTIKTLYAMSYTVGVEMHSLFSRNSIQEDDS